MITSQYEAANHFSRDDHTQHLSKLCNFLQPLVANLSHNLILSNQNLLSLFQSYSREFNVEEFAFYVEDFAKIHQEKATIYCKDDSDEVIEILPKYPFKFQILIDTNSCLQKNTYVAIREFDEIVSLHRLDVDKKTSTSQIGGSNYFKTVDPDNNSVKINYNLEYNVNNRISGIMDQNIILLQSKEFKILNYDRLKGWTQIFRNMKNREHFFPFVPISNNITLKLKTKY